jgi:ABC-type multidrug transport system fused ATPase/permease subunit
MNAPARELHRLLNVLFSLLTTCTRTGRVDSETDELMQDIIRTHFKDRTVLAITHRLKTVLDFDKVIVMEESGVIETGSPRELLARPSAFKDLLEGNGSETVMK